MSLPNNLPKRPTLVDIDGHHFTFRVWEAIKVWPEITAKPIEGSEHHVYYLEDIHMEELMEDLDKVFDDVGHKTTSDGFNIGIALSEKGWPTDAWLVETINATVQHARRELLEDAVEQWVEDHELHECFPDIEGCTVTYDRIFPGIGMKEVSGKVTGGDAMSYIVYTKEPGEKTNCSHVLPVEKIKSTSPPGRFH